jgi:hypothetical protein
MQVIYLVFLVDTNLQSCLLWVLLKGRVVLTLLDISSTDIHIYKCIFMSKASACFYFVLYADHPLKIFQFLTNEKIPKHSFIRCISGTHASRVHIRPFIGYL